MKLQQKKHIFLFTILIRSVVATNSLSCAALIALNPPVGLINRCHHLCQYCHKEFPWICSASIQFYWCLAEYCCRSRRYPTNSILHWQTDMVWRVWANKIYLLSHTVQLACWFLTNMQHTHRCSDNTRNEFCWTRIRIISLYHNWPYLSTLE